LERGSVREKRKRVMLLIGGQTMFERKGERPGESRAPLFG
jgi:hypothetical protein